MDIASVVSVLIALAALATACLTLRQQIINLTVIREERYFKEMDLLVKKLFQKREKYELFEPHHVDPNNPEEKRNADEFWREIRENKYLAPKELGDIIERYLELVNKHEQKILEKRTTLSDLLMKRCEKLESLEESVSDRRILNPIDTCVKTKLCPLLGKGGLVKPMPTDDRLKTTYLKTWQDKEGIIYYLNTNPNEELRGPALSYFDAIHNPELSGPDGIVGSRGDLSTAAENRYKELEEKIRTIRADLEAKSKHWYRPWK